MLLDHFTGKIFLTSLLFIALTVAVDCKWGVLPIGGLILLIYVLLVFCLTVWLTSNLMRRILSQNRPIVYDFQNNPYLSYAKRCYLSFKVRPSEDGRAETPATARRPKNIDERIDDFTEDVEAFVRRWFGPISRDGLFPRETRGLVDDIVRRFLQVAVEVDGKRLSHGVLVILLNHAKEYQRTVRRQKRKSGSIEDLYRYAHVASNNAGTFEHVIRQLTGKLLRQFIGWEVYSSVPCKAVASVLAKKLTAPLLIHVSSPPFINHKLASICRTSLELDPYDAVSLSDVDLSETVLTETADRTNLAPLGESLRSESNTPKVSPKRFDGADSASVLDETITEVDDGKAISPPVKIHESRSSTKTWRNSSDLECISLGQDLLVGQDFADPDSDIQNLIGKKLWKDSSGDFLESEDKPPPAQPLFEEPIDLAKDLIANIPSATIPSFISNTIKPIGNVTLQELQQTTVNSVVRPVSSAMHRIGDLQDEAAGMMEGIFDLGMAGIRRGLRLTGLQDGDRLRADPTRSKPVSAEPSPDGRAKRLSRAAPVGSEDSLRSEETVWTNPLTRDSPDFDGQILLERPAPSVAVEDLDGSPDPEYEDATDLATTTAKLRSLLQQKTTESNLTTPAVSPMPADETGRSLSTMSTSTDYPDGSVEDLTAVDGALPSLYKFCARTATGVFQNTLNTLKTALPGTAAADQEGGRQESAGYEDADNWMYVASDLTQDDLTVKIKRLLNERRAFCVVDNAYEAVESLDVLDHAEPGWNTPTRKYDDDLDELEIYIPLTKTLLDIFCELAADPNGLLIPESVVKSLLILCGSVAEEHLASFGARSVRSVSGFIGKLPTGSRRRPMALSIGDFTQIFLDKVPGVLKYVVGEEIFSSAIRTFLSSIQCQKINQDVALQILELFTSILIEANSKLSPTYSA